MSFEVDTHLLPMKGHYFLFNAGKLIVNYYEKFKGGSEFLIVKLFLLLFAGTAPVVPFIPVS